MSLDLEEAQSRLLAISELVSDLFRSKQDMLVSTKESLERIKRLAYYQPFDTKKFAIYISRCETMLGILTVNPEGKTNILTLEVTVKELDKATYIAAYHALTTLFNIHNIVKFPIEIRTDDLSFARDMMSKEESKFQNLKDQLLEFRKISHAPIFFLWRPVEASNDLGKALELATEKVIGK